MLKWFSIRIWEGRGSDRGPFKEFVYVLAIIDSNHEDVCHDKSLVAPELDPRAPEYLALLYTAGPDAQ
jgi:hypothetical protein